MFDPDMKTVIIIIINNHIVCIGSIEDVLLFVINEPAALFTIPQTKNSFKNQAMYKLQIKNCNNSVLSSSAMQ